MKDFKYCIWYTPGPDHPWNYFTNKFIPHLSIKTGLTESQAFHLFSIIKKQDIEIEFDNLMSSENKGFNALYYTIKDKSIKPQWWPKNPHISFLYKYDEKITGYEIRYLYTKMNYKKGVLKYFHIVKCTGHYSTWKIILSK